jgi:predicted dehydrogenase
MKRFYFAVCILLLTVLILATTSIMQGQTSSNSPMRLAIAGTTHGHVSWILNRKDKKDILIVGIYEPNVELAEKHSRNYGIKKELFYTDLGKMIEETKPEGVVAFGSIYEHLAVVEASAPRGVHVMVEKPLAVNLDHAVQIEKLAKKHNIHVLTNYETSWYLTTEKTYQLINDSNYLGKLKKGVFHHGHQGPKEIGVSKEFLSWLTDPVQNGGGALIDFGCYGANLMTYLMKGIEPISVMAVTQQFKPHIYPKVDDETTIVVSYPNAQCIIQASWNWPFNRKDMELYGETGYIIAQNARDMITRNITHTVDRPIRLDAADVKVYTDPFSYLADVIRKKTKVEDHGLYSLQNNITVMKILDAAKQSASTGKVVTIKKSK